MARTQSSLGPVDIYDIEGRYKSAERNLLNDSQASKRNKELVFDFVRDLKLKGAGRSRQLYYVLRFTNIVRNFKKDLDQADAEDIKKIVEFIQDNKRWSERTKVDHQIAVKRFYKWLRGNDEEYPREVRWISTTEKKKKRLTPEDLVSEDDLRLLLQHASNSKERAILWVLWEGGVRIGELLSMRIKDIIFDDMGAVAHVNGKTGYRPVRLVSAVPAVSEYLEHHPTKYPEHALWMTETARPMKYQAVSEFIRRLRARSDIGKRLHAHLFRKSAATRVAPHLREAVMKNYFGWTQASRMTAVYIHMSGAAVDDEILRLYGKVPKREETADKLAPKECNICGTSNTPERDWCIRCRHPVSEKAKAQALEGEKMLLTSLNAEMLEELVQRKVNELLAKQHNTVILTTGGSAGSIKIGKEKIVV